MGNKVELLDPRNAKNSSDEVGRKCHQSSTPQVVGIDKVSLLMRPDYLDPRSPDGNKKGDCDPFVSFVRTTRGQNRTDSVVNIVQRNRLKMECWRG